MTDVDDARDLVAAARRIVLLTGAGISTHSGIPDFRGRDGVWTRDPGSERVSTLSWFLGDDEVRRAAWQHRAHSPVWHAAPNAAHYAVAGLEAQRRLRAVVTQNTDGLHQLAGSSPGRVLELHGNERRCRCERCGAEVDTIDVVERVLAGEADPRCEATTAGGPCGGILRARTILFEEELPRGVLDRAIEAVYECDLLLCAGTLLSVYPAAGLAPLAKRTGAALVIANNEPTDYDAIADAVVRTDLVESLPRLLAPPTPE